jgi:nucleotidyltransferase substrate binding protein (TIGR01987 family)
MPEQEKYQKKYENFSKIVLQLNRHLQTREMDSFSELEQSGLVTQFELSFELLWKLLKDYLVYNGVEIEITSPKNVLRAAASSGLFEQIGAEGEVLMAALTARNQLTHVYDYTTAMDLLEDIKRSYLPEMLKVEQYFDGK